MPSGDRHGLIRTIDYLRSHGVTPQIAEKYELGIVNPERKVDEPYEGCLAIPYQTRAGVVAVKYRCTRDHDHGSIPNHAKYGQPGNQKPRTFNSAAYFDADRIIGVCEGEIDAIVATEILGIPTVGIPGVDHWRAMRKVWRRNLEDYETVLVFADNDPPNVQHPGRGGPGFALAKWILSDMGERGRMVPCDAGEDISSMVTNGKADVLRERAGLSV